MIRAGVNDPKSYLILAGLVEGNLARLKAGYPIRANLSTFGLDLPGSLVIAYGTTEADLEAQLRRAGVVGPETSIVRDSRVEEEAAIRSHFKNVLIATVGLPRSGKTTWAQSQAYPIVNPDSIRLAIHGQRFIAAAEPFVWATAKAMVRALFLAGHGTVILDATNTTRKRRDEWQSSEWGTFWKVMDTPREECERRAQQDAEILPVIARMAEQYEAVELPERRWP